MKTSAMNSSNLSGAEGGLNQAKVINVSIDTVQKIVENAGADGSKIKDNASQAINILIRSINNLTYSMSGTM